MAIDSDGGIGRTASFKFLNQIICELITLMETSVVMYNRFENNYL